MTDDLAALGARHQPVPSRNFFTGAIEADWCCTCNTAWGDHGCDAALAFAALEEEQQSHRGEYVQGLQDALEQERQARQAAEAALAKINEIRNSIIGLHTVNWSEHIYPLVAALNDAGQVGMHYPEAREHFGTMLERTNVAEAREARLRAALENLVQACYAEHGAYEHENYESWCCVCVAMNEARQALAEAG